MTHYLLIEHGRYFYQCKVLLEFQTTVGRKKWRAPLDELRENWLNPADLIDRVPEVVPGLPDCILPKGDKAAKELKKRTLTNLNNARPTWLGHAHRALSEAVTEAYGWGEDWRAGVLTDDEILERLFQLNQGRAAKQKSEGPMIFNTEKLPSLNGAR